MEKRQAARNKRANSENDKTAREQRFFIIFLAIKI